MEKLISSKLIGSKKERDACSNFAVSFQLGTIITSIFRIGTGPTHFPQNLITLYSQLIPTLHYSLSHQAQNMTCQFQVFLVPSHLIPIC